MYPSNLFRLYDTRFIIGPMLFLDGSHEFIHTPWPFEVLPSIRVPCDGGDEAHDRKHNTSVLLKKREIG